MAQALLFWGASLFNFEERVVEETNHGVSG
jgi:hypothetical protein